MTRDPIADPEVIADLQLRARTERDPSRRGAAYDWRPAPVVEYWPCRGCSDPVGMTAEAIETAKTCNRKLIALGDRPFRKSELAVCEPCRAAERQAERERDQRRAASVAALSRELRAGVLPWREAAIADELRALGENAADVIRRATETTTTTTTKRRPI